MFTLTLLKSLHHLGHFTLHADSRLMKSVASGTIGQRTLMMSVDLGQRISTSTTTSSSITSEGSRRKSWCGPITAAAVAAIVVVVQIFVSIGLVGRPAPVVEIVTTIVAGHGVTSFS